MKKVLSLILAIAVVFTMAGSTFAAGTIKDISGFVDDTLDFIGSTPAEESERWKSGTHTIDVSGDVQAISGTGDTSNSKAVFYGLKRDGAYKFAQIFDNANGNQILRISYNFTNKAVANANLQLGFNPLNSSNGSNGRNYIYKFNLNDGKITSAGGAEASVTAPVGTTIPVTMLVNLKTGESRLYVGKGTYIQNNNVFQTSGRFIKSFILWVDKAVNYSYEISDLSFTVYNAQTTMDEVGAYAYATADELYTPKYGYEYEGIQDSGICSLGNVDLTREGDNTNGYVLTAKSSFSNAGNGAVGRLALVNADKTDIPQTSVLYHSFDYTPGTVTNTQRFGIRGGNGYQWFLEFRADGTISGTDNAMTWKVGETYKIAFLADLTTDKYFYLINDDIVKTGTIYSARTPLWQVCYSMLGVNDSMIIKNLYTIVHEEDADFYAVLDDVADNVFAKITEFIYDQTDDYLTVTATLAGDSSKFDEGDLVYALYDAEGKLVGVSFETAASSDVNATEFGRTYPYGFFSLENIENGTVLTVKAFLWSGVDGLKPISTVAHTSYTVEKAAE